MSGAGVRVGCRGQGEEVRMWDQGQGVGVRE